MASIIYTPKDIYEADFKTSVRGYSKQEVDEFLDDVIKDYETYVALVKELREENARLKEELAAKPKVEKSSPAPFQTNPTPMPSMEVPQTTGSISNFDILRRLNRLEKEVFGKQIVDTDSPFY